MSRTALALVLTAALTSPAIAAPTGARLVDHAPQPNAPAGAHLTYNMGPMIQHVKIFMIFYSPNYQFKSQLVSFYQSVLQSPYIDMLQEYDTTNYKIRRGSYLGLYEDTNANPASVKTVAPATYLQGLISGKKVPAPDGDTLYMIYFPSNINPTDPNGGASCVSGGGFCAYHNSMNVGGQNAYYGVMPDTPTDCSPGCGPTGFAGLTDVSSHEFVEAMTDPDVGQNNLAWYDNTNGEIGDICNGMSATVGSNTVQTEWSNQKGACIATNPMYTVNDFSVAVTPATALTVPVGGMTTATVTLTKTAGNADTAMLKASGLPTGVVVSFAPTSATTAGGTSMMTVSAGANATLGMAKFSLDVAGLTASHSQDVQVMIVSPPDMAMSPDLAQPAGGGSGGSGGGGSGGSGGGGSGGSGGGNGTGGNGNNGGGGSSGCSIGGAAGIGGVWTLAALLLFAFAFRRRRA